MAYEQHLADALARETKLKSALCCMYDTLSAVHMVTGGEEPYPFHQGHLRRQIADDLAIAQTVLGMTRDEIIDAAEAEEGDGLRGTPPSPKKAASE